LAATQHQGEQLAEQTSELESSRHTLESVQDQLSTEQGFHAYWRRKCADLENAMHDAQNRHNDEVGVLERQIDALKAQLMSQQDDAKHSVQEPVALPETDQNVLKLQAVIERLEIENQMLQARSQKIEKHDESYAAELDEYRELVGKLEHELLDARIAHDAVCADLQFTLRNQSATVNRCDTLYMQCENLKVELDECQRRLRAQESLVASASLTVDVAQMHDRTTPVILDTDSQPHSAVVSTPVMSRAHSLSTPLGSVLAELEDEIREQVQSANQNSTINIANESNETMFQLVAMAVKVWLFRDATVNTNNTTDAQLSLIDVPVEQLFQEATAQHIAPEQWHAWLMNRLCGRNVSVRLADTTASVADLANWAAGNARLRRMSPLAAARPSANSEAVAGLQTRAAPIGQRGAAAAAAALKALQAMPTIKVPTTTQPSSLQPSAMNRLSSTVGAARVAPKQQLGAHLSVDDPSIDLVNLTAAAAATPSNAQNEQSPNVATENRANHVVELVAREVDDSLLSGQPSIASHSVLAIPMNSYSKPLFRAPPSVDDSILNSPSRLPEAPELPKPNTVKVPTTDNASRSAARALPMSESVNKSGTIASTFPRMMSPTGNSIFVALESAFSKFSFGKSTADAAEAPKENL
jgi:uncharacterized membrane protein